MASKLPVAKLITEIKREHEWIAGTSLDLVKHVVRCGQLLAALRAASNGNWEQYVVQTGMSTTTAWRYIKVSQDIPKKRCAYLLDRGATLVDLYRELGLVKACEGGGYRSEAYQKRKAIAGAQLEMEFQYEEAAPHFEALLRAANVEKYGESTIRRLR